MTEHEKYMHRCLQLAQNGRGSVAPNPMVGSVIVHEGRIIGEGYHRKYGQGHAEVNAINSVKDKAFLEDSTIYVSLEPCSHYGKTPPCAQLIIDNKISRVVVACLDPYAEVSGRGVEMLRDAGVEVLVGVLEDSAIMLNKEFFTAQIKKRPYIYLKWAQSKDGYIDSARVDFKREKPTQISNDFSKLLVHKMRARIQAIMVGTNTIIRDDPSLTTRFWYGQNPIRIVFDRHNRIPQSSQIFDGNVETFIFTETLIHENKNNAVTYIVVHFDEFLLPSIFEELGRLKINSIMVEGGSQLLQSLIDINLWDEAFVEVGDVIVGDGGVQAPRISCQKQPNLVDVRRKYTIYNLTNSEVRD